MPKKGIQNSKFKIDFVAKEIIFGGGWGGVTRKARYATEDTGDARFSFTLLRMETEAHYVVEK